MSVNIYNVKHVRALEHEFPALRTQQVVTTIVLARHMNAAQATVRHYYDSVRDYNFVRHLDVRPRVGGIIIG